MTFTYASARELARLVGTSYAEMNCWAFVRAAFAFQDVELPSSYHTAIDQSWFRRVEPDEAPEPWDVVAIELPRDRADVELPKFANHCGIYLGESELIHSVDPAGVSVNRLDRAPWSKRIVGLMRLQVPGGISKTPPLMTDGADRP